MDRLLPILISDLRFPEHIREQMNSKRTVDHAYALIDIPVTMCVRITSVVQRCDTRRLRVKVLILKLSGIWS